jgi:hypothetical protein
LEVFYSQEAYPDKLRRIRYFDAEQNKRFIFLTKNFTTMPSIYHRETVSVPLANRTFLQMDKAALSIQNILWNPQCHQNPDLDSNRSLRTGGPCQKAAALLNLSLYTILQILSVTLFEKRPFWRLLLSFGPKNQKGYSLTY